MKLKKVLLGVLLVVLGIASITAQDAIATTGGEASGSEGSVSYTVGQVFFATKGDIKRSISEGVQQAFTISVPDGIEETGINLNISAYPNPAQQYLNLEVDASTMQNFQSLRYQLFDMNGKLLASDRIVGNITTIETSRLNPAVYFVKILSDKKEIKTFKVIKY